MHPFATSACTHRNHRQNQIHQGVVIAHVFKWAKLYHYAINIGYLGHIYMQLQFFRSPSLNPHDQIRKLREAFAKLMLTKITVTP